MNTKSMNKVAQEVTTARAARVKPTKVYDARRNVHVSAETNAILTRLGINKMSALIKATAWLAENSPTVLELIHAEIAGEN